MAMKTYIIHATCRYVTQNKETGETYSGQNRPTLSIDASSREAAIRKATREQKKAMSSDWWPVVSFHLIPELVREIDHPTPAQRKVLRRFRDGQTRGCDMGMLNRLIEKGWIVEGGTALTPAGRREAG